jgi:hypothetical protein
MLNPNHLFRPLVQAFTNCRLSTDWRLKIYRNSTGAAQLRFQERRDVFIGDTVCTLSVLFLMKHSTQIRKLLVQVLCIDMAEVANLDLNPNQLLHCAEANGRGFI